MTLLEQAKAIKAATFKMMNTGCVIRDKALMAMADALVENAPFILRENEKDIDTAREKGKGDAMIDRLRLTKERIEGMANGLRKVAALPDPIGSEDHVVKRPNGLSIGKRRVPLGAIGIIYEARPNVTADAAGLCIKSGNTALLRGGSEAIHSNVAVIEVLEKAAMEAGLPEGCLGLVRDTSRETAQEMMRLNGYLDVLIPRGGATLIKSVVQNATVPVIETGLGNCHTYVHEAADIAMATDIIYNAKVSRPAVCNAMETLLIDESIKMSLKEIVAPLLKSGVELRGCEKACAVVTGMKEAVEEDWATEYHDYILAVKVVDDIDEAIAHINRYGTMHSECIVTKDYFAAEKFLNEVDAAAVYVNASTRFTDGEEFGFGAEIGISTQKLHARGPMGLNELTSVKYIVRGNGQVR
ncbi:glutamate-5-semialdehyde dehydrogenase [Christensenellaceae bacterium OttesenSCG-928-M15]|nr:glutamate-5-semialdehyde dehydrogenase [Christensenellaceae bacterium OttesenSCG-928-M15]